jgi:hypothetical protein
MPRARLAVLLTHFSQIDDDREPWRVVYPLVEVLLLLTCCAHSKTYKCRKYCRFLALSLQHIGRRSPCRHRIRSRTSLERGVIALQHQLSVLKRQRPGRVRFFRADRLLWILPCRILPRAINAMVLVKSATVLQ